MSTPPRGAGGQADPRPPRRAGQRWWVAALAFLGGLVVGVVLVGLLSSGAPPLPAAGGAAASEGSVPPGAAGGTVPGDGATGQAVVAGACLRAANEAEDAYTAIDDVGGAAASLDATRLDDVVRRLQPLQERLQADLAACRVSTRLGGGSTPATSSPPPSGSATG